MNNKIITAMFFLMILLSSCGYSLRTTQVFHTESSVVKMVNDKYRYEDSIVIIDYDLWASGGILNFNIYNRTSEPIYINWRNCNFIFNGYSNEYWTDKVVSTTNSSAIFRTDGWQTGQTKTSYNSTNPYKITDSKYHTVSTLAGIENSVTVVQKENPTVQIPPNSFNQIAKFSIQMPLLTNADSLITYLKSTTPLIFRNYLALSKDKEFVKQIFIDNDFWISSVKTTYEKKAKWDVPPQITKQPTDFYIINKKFIEAELE